MNKKEMFLNTFQPFAGSKITIDKTKHKRIAEVKTTNKEKLVASIQEVFDRIPIKDGNTLSFHHHLRSGDYVLNLVCEEIKRRGLKNIHLAPSALFPHNQIVCELIKSKAITKITTNYISGPIATTIGEGTLDGLLVMDTHGGRPRAIESGELAIDVAFIATPQATSVGDGNGLDGKSACGVLGYAISDMKYAKHKVVVTDSLVESCDIKEIDGTYIDYVVVVDSIGNPKGIVSGTTAVTKDPVGLKIAKDAARFLDEAGYLVAGFSMQTGAGGTSLAVANEVRKIMKAKSLTARMISGGITGYFVDMLEQGMVDRLMDVQCFDLRAVESIRKNKNHFAMSASKYANPYDEPIVNDLDFVVLGAAEIDLDFNVNVTTASNGVIIGGSGGHSDTAYGAKCTIIVSPLIKSRTPIVRQNVTTITTPGENVDVFISDRGIAIHPNRIDLWEKMKHSTLPLHTMEELMNKAHRITGIPKQKARSDEIVGLVRYRDGTIIDNIYKTGK